LLLSRHRCIIQIVAMPRASSERRGNAINGTRNSGSGGRAKSGTAPKGKPAQTTIARSVALEDSLMAVWNEIAALDVERLVVLDKDGNRIFAKDGTESSVPITYAESAKMRGAATIHNHPDTDGVGGLPTTFSPDDLKTAIVIGQSEATVCNASMMASFQLLPTSNLGRFGARVRFLCPLMKAQRGINKELKATKVLYDKGIVSYDAALQVQRDAIERGTNKVRGYLREKQKEFGYVYEERATVI
jgi:hypothetical protein